MQENIYSSTFSKKMISLAYYIENLPNQKVLPLDAKLS